MTQRATDFSGLLDSLMGDPLTLKVINVDRPMHMEFTYVNHVKLAEFAVRFVALSDPAGNNNPDLQDPLRHQFARDMVAQYADTADAAGIFVSGYNAPGK